MIFVATFENVKTAKGFITCWNIQNMAEPEIFMSTSSKPTVAKFAPEFPRLLAVGDETGLVHFVDIGSNEKHLARHQIPGTYIHNFQIFIIYGAT